MELKFNYNVPDKNTGKNYIAGEIYEFTKERAKEILSVINNETGLPFAVEVKETTKPENKKVNNKTDKKDKKEKPVIKEDTTK